MFFEKIVNLLLGKSIRTSIMGWAVLVVAVGNFIIVSVDGNPDTVPDPEEIKNALVLLSIAIPTWLQGILSRDRKVSDVEEGVPAVK